MQDQECTLWWFPIALTGVLPPEQSSCWESDFRLVWRAWGCRSLKGTAFRGVVQSMSPIQYGFTPVARGESGQITSPSFGNLCTFIWSDCLLLMWSVWILRSSFVFEECSQWVIGKKKWSCSVAWEFLTPSGTYLILLGMESKRAVG